jgi:hypothetical protein
MPAKSKNHLGKSCITKGSRKTKFSFLRVAAPARQGAKAQAYQDMSSFRNAARQDASVLKNVKLFLCEP